MSGAQPQTLAQAQAQPQAQDNSERQTFESICHTDHNKEIWFARELAPVLDYQTWSKFEEVITNAKKACETAGVPVERHFENSGKTVKRGLHSTRVLPDYKLSRYACALIVKNADPSKQVIAQAQTYFDMQARRQEMQVAVNDPQTEDQRRLTLRKEITDHNKTLVGVAHAAGVNTKDEYSSFHNRGYEGLYGGLNAKDIHQRKALKENDKILDFMGSTELSANLFRTTQTEDKLKREQIQGADNVIKTHFDVGQKVRKTIQELGGVMPENLPKPDKSVHQLEAPGEGEDSPKVKKQKKNKK